MHSRPWLPQQCHEAIRAVLRSGMIGQGETTREFERRMSAWVGAADGVAVGSGSAAVFLALAALEAGDGSEVILPTYVCPSVMDAVLTAGATPVLCDVGRDWVVTADNIKDLVNAHTRAIIVPHMYGIFADVASVRALGIPVIEDSAQAVDAHGARRIAGDILVFSFHPTKCLTTGEGGMAVTARADLLEKMRVLRDGTGNRPRLFSPLADTGAALGVAQLEIYPEGLERRRRIAAAYREALQAVAPQILPPEQSGTGTMYFRFPLRVPGGLDAFAAEFWNEGIVVRRGVDRLLHRLAGLPDRRFPVAIRLFETTLSLPIYPALSEKELSRCIAAVRRILGAYRFG